MKADRTTAEEQRLKEARDKNIPWKKWGPYLSERQWGTVREDYSDNGDAWNYFSHDQARFRAYRWGEDGLGGLCDNQQVLCLALALWNGEDPILKGARSISPTARGIHQTGWTGLVVKMIEFVGRMDPVKFLEAGRAGAYAGSKKP